MTARVRVVCRVQSRVCVGGPARQTILLSSRLDASRFRTLLISGRVEDGEEDLSNAARTAGITTVVVPEMRRAVHPVLDLIAYWKLVRIFREERPAIVHTHTAKAGTIGRLAAITTRVPVVIHTFHGHVFDGYFPWAVTAFFKLVERALARSTDAVIAISEGQKHDLCVRHRIVNPEKVRVLPLGLDLDRFLEARSWAGAFREELGVDASTPLIGFAGRLTEVKDPALLLAAFSKVDSPGPRQPHLVVAGEGALRPRLESLADDLGIEKRTHFLGTRDDLDRVYADLDVVVLTSRNEGTPVSLIEAMAAGIPIVATDVGGVREVLESYPLARLVRTRDPEDIAAEIRMCLADRPCRTDGRRFVARFAAERLVSDIENVYEELLATNAGRLRIEERKLDRAA